MASTSISWTDKVWNPTRGCRRISEGCGGAKGEGGCYAERQGYRFSGPGQPYEGLIKLTANGPRWTGAGHFATDKLAEPLSWRKPQRVFVDSMSDLFFDTFTNEQIAAVFGVMAACPHITFQVLTKRPKRMREWFAWVATAALDRIVCAADDVLIETGWSHADRVAALHRVGRTPIHLWHLPNVWLGVSVENQAAADERIPDLLATPAAVRFLSCEPLIGRVDLERIAQRRTDNGLGMQSWERTDSLNGSRFTQTWGGPWIWNGLRGPRINWVIAGCESGPGARACNIAWLRSLRDQCAAAGVAFFLKQAEESADCGEDRLLDVGDDDSLSFGDGSKMKKRRTGGNRIIEQPYLDGVQHTTFPTTGASR